MPFLIRARRWLPFLALARLLASQASPAAAQLRGEAAAPVRVEAGIGSAGLGSAASSILPQPALAGLGLPTPGLASMAPAPSPVAAAQAGLPAPALAEPPAAAPALAEAQAAAQDRAPRHAQAQQHPRAAPALAPAAVYVANARAPRRADLLGALQAAVARFVQGPPAAAPALGRLFDAAGARASDPSPDGPSVGRHGFRRHFDHASDDDEPFPGDDDGNPLIVPERLKALLPSAYDKETWTGRISLHMHSVFSDGTMSPEAAVEAAYQAGVRSAALTDHDTTAGIVRAWRKAKELGMDFHPGAELSARGGVHIGAIDVDIHNPELAALLARMREVRWSKAQVIIGNLNASEEFKRKGIVITIEEVAGKSSHGQGGTIEVPHIARVLVDRGLIKRVDDAYDTYLKGDAFKGIDKYPDSTVDEVLHAIRAAGGKAILNHPYTVRTGNRVEDDDQAAFWERDTAEQDRRIEEILAKGLDAIEVYRPVNATSENGKRRADARAAKYLLWVDEYSRGRLMVAAPGADFHGGDTHLNKLAVWMPKHLAGQLLESLRDANAAALASLERNDGATPTPRRRLVFGVALLAPLALLALLHPPALVALLAVLAAAGLAVLAAARRPK